MLTTFFRILYVNSGHRRRRLAGAHLATSFSRICLPHTLVFDLTPQTAVVFWELSYTRFLALKIVCCCEQCLLGTMNLRDIYSSFVGAPCSHYISVFSR